MKFWRIKKCARFFGPPCTVYQLDLQWALRANFVVVVVIIIIYWLLRTQHTT